MPKQSTGYIFKDKATGKWVARITATDPSGKRRNIKRYCPTKTEARKKLDDLKRELSERGEQSIDGGKMKFREASERYSAVKLTKAVYVGEKHVAGMRSLAGPKLHLRVLVAHFGNRLLRSITHADIEAFKLERLKAPVRGVQGKARSVAAVNRELETMRSLLNFCVRQGWLSVNPFTRGESLIDKSKENSRERVMSFEEEARLLSACVDRLAHLRPIIIIAADSGMRRGEMIKIEWRDVDFGAGEIRLRPIITKTNKGRSIRMTDRARAELLRLWEVSTRNEGARVFGIKDNFAKAWRSACASAGVTNLKFHDLRHTFISRLISAGVQHTEAMKLSGHQTLGMLNKYLNINAEASRRAADALDRYRRETTGDGLEDLASDVIN